MVAYEYYWHDEIKGFELIGVLPERRKETGRVTKESILGFGKKFWGNDMDKGSILFIRVEVDKGTGQIIRPKPPLGFDFED
ncbi:MAG TPA: hypothetical protein VMV04_07200 [Thermodesulfobacteriota bacterium]|nr:hypothetical protein [Thermodesulfobacteriota bacterium]